MSVKGSRVDCRITELRLLLKPAATYCVQPYYNHPRGCPNVGRKPGCPPASVRIETVMAMDKPMWVVWNEFDLAAHRLRMLDKHPNWTDRQQDCCLYWQNSARKQLRRIVDRFLAEHLMESFNHACVLWTPEANGVDVTGTMAACGVSLEWPVRTLARQVVVIGYAQEIKHELTDLFDFRARLATHVADAVG
jgi:hypothetical protein